MIPFLEGCFGCLDGYGGGGSRLSEQTKSQMADIHDRPGLVKIYIHDEYNNWFTWPTKSTSSLCKDCILSRESPCLPSTMFFMHFWFFGQSAGIELFKNLKILIDADKILDSLFRRPRSDGRTLPFLYKLSWGLEVNFEQCLIFHRPCYCPLLRTWFQPLLFSSLFSTGPCFTLMWSSTDILRCNSSSDRDIVDLTQ